MTITTEQIQGLTGNVYASGSDKIGSIGQVYLDDTSGTPSWVTVKTGLFGTTETFVPLEGGRVDGDDVYVDFSEDKIKDAPRVDADGSLSPQEEDELYRYYGLTDAGTGTGRTDPSPKTVGHDTSGPTTDDAMTRSEERLNVGTTSRESGRARLRKHVVTEHVTQTVPVRHEEVSLQREPITDASPSGAEIGEEEYEVVLHEEVPVVDKEVVAVERVRLGTKTVTEDTTVSEDVRKEKVEIVETDAG